MSVNIGKVLIVGATSGIGEGIARRFAQSNKAIILAGRRKDRLDSVQEELSTINKCSVDTIQWDISDLSSIAPIVAKIIKAHPDLDTVLLNSGIMKNHNITDINSSTRDEIVIEITTNFTALVLLTREFLPHLFSIAASGRYAALLATSSGLAFTPAPSSPVYCATKAAVHSLMVSTRQSVATHANPEVREFLSICEIVPPMVSTDLTKSFKSFRAPMDLEEYLDDMYGKLERGCNGDANGKLPWEVASGTAEERVEAWSGAMRPILNGYGLKE